MGISPRPPSADCHAVYNNTTPNSQMYNDTEKNNNTRNGLPLTSGCIGMIRRKSNTTSWLKSAKLTSNDRPRSRGSTHTRSAETASSASQNLHFTVQWTYLIDLQIRMPR